MTHDIAGTKQAHDWHTSCLIKGFEAPFDTWNDSQLTYTYVDNNKRKRKRHLKNILITLEIICY